MRRQNYSTATEFLLLGFTTLHGLEIAFFIAFSTIYLVTVIGNISIMLVVYLDAHLHTPMYFFLMNLSFLDICFTSTTAPRMLANLLSEDKRISFAGCIGQLYFFLSLGVTESFLLAAMAYDRYVAICNPLRYMVVVNRQACFHLSLACWMSGFLMPCLPIFLVSRLPFCGRNVINHFFCDLSPLMQLSCVANHLQEVLNFAAALTVVLSSFLLILFSYTRIISTVLRIRSSQGRQKAFSTCSSHITVLLIYYGTIIFIYLRPASSGLFDLDKVVSVFYCAITPMLNPIIYTLRNKNVKEALLKVIGTKAPSHNS